MLFLLPFLPPSEKIHFAGRVCSLAEISLWTKSSFFLPSLRALLPRQLVIIFRLASLPFFPFFPSLDALQVSIVGKVHFRSGFDPVVFSRVQSSFLFFPPLPLFFPVENKKGSKPFALCCRTTMLPEGRLFFLSSLSSSFFSFGHRKR